MSEPVDPFRIRAHVADFEAVSDQYRTMSDAARATIRHIPDIAYGPGPAERLDVFLPERLDAPAPVHLFIHGGYWRANRKEDYAFVAAPVVGAGAIAVIVEYALMPAARMATLVDQVRRAAAWVRTHIAEHGGDPDMLSASGHSAGGHLASYLAARAPHEPTFPLAPLRSLLVVSGIYDLAPVARSFLQPEIGLTPEEIAHWSPLDATLAPDIDITLAVGAAETVPFLEQATTYAAMLGTPPRILSELDHMTIVRDLGRPGTAMADLLVATIAASRSPDKKGRPEGRPV